MIATNHELNVGASGVDTEGEASGHERTYDNARRDFDAQFDEGCGCGYSLHSMWRACGSPAGYSPAEWLKIAGPFVEGYLGYLRKLQLLVRDDTPALPSVVYTVSPEDRARDRRAWDGRIAVGDDVLDLGPYVEPAHFLVGDSIAVPFIAEQYLYFLGGTRDSVLSIIHPG